MFLRKGSCLIWTAERGVDVWEAGQVLLGGRVDWGGVSHDDTTSSIDFRLSSGSDCIYS